MKKILYWIRKKNEFTFVITLVILIWFFVPVLFQKMDPEVGEFSLEILYIPLIAGIFFFIALLFIWIYIWLVWPKSYRLLDEVFVESEKLSTWERLQVLLRLFCYLVILFAVSLLAVTGISAIM